MTQQLMLTLFPFFVVLIFALIIYIIKITAYRRGYRWICPNCGLRQTGWSHQCPRCGIVFKEWKE